MRVLQQTIRRFRYRSECTFICEYLLRAGEANPQAVAELERADDLRTATANIVIAVAESGPVYRLVVIGGILGDLTEPGLRRVMSEALKFLRKKGLLPKRANETDAAIMPGTIPDSAVDGLIEDWLVGAVVSRVLAGSGPP